MSSLKPGQPNGLNGANPNSGLSADGSSMHLPVGPNNQTDHRWLPTGARDATQPPAESYVDPRLGPQGEYVALYASINGAAGSLDPDLRRDFRDRYLSAVDTAANVADARTMAIILGSSGAPSPYAKNERDRGVTPDGAKLAGFMLQQQRQILADAVKRAKEALADLRPKILKAGVPSCPEGASDDDVRDRRDELAEAIGSASGAGQRNIAAQQILRLALADQDTLTLHALLSDAFRFKAQALGISLDTLRRVYLKARADSDGDRPMFPTAGAQLVAQHWDDLDKLISLAQGLANAGLDGAAALIGG